jgi:hypothetical protein
MIDVCSVELYQSSEALTKKTHTNIHHRRLRVIVGLTYYNLYVFINN